MTQQLDMVPLDAASLERIGEQLPKARDVTEPRFQNVQINITCNTDQFLRAMKDIRCRLVTGRSVDEALAEASRADVGHELVLPERAREDHR